MAADCLFPVTVRVEKYRLALVGPSDPAK